MNGQASQPCKPSVMAHTFNFSTREAEAEKSLRSSPARTIGDHVSIMKVLRQPNLTSHGCLRGNLGKKHCLPQAISKPSCTGLSVLCTTAATSHRHEVLRTNLPVCFSLWLLWPTAMTRESGIYLELHLSP